MKSRVQQNLPLIPFLLASPTMISFAQLLHFYAVKTKKETENLKREDAQRLLQHLSKTDHTQMRLALRTYAEDLRAFALMPEIIHLLNLIKELDDASQQVESLLQPMPQDTSHDLLNYITALYKPIKLVHAKMQQIVLAASQISTPGSVPNHQPIPAVTHLLMPQRRTTAANSSSLSEDIIGVTLDKDEKDEKHGEDEKDEVKTNQPMTESPNTSAASKFTLANNEHSDEITQRNEGARAQSDRSGLKPNESPEKYLERNTTIEERALIASFTPAILQKPSALKKRNNTTAVSIRPVIVTVANRDNQSLFTLKKKLQAVLEIYKQTKRRELWNSSTVKRKLEAIARIEHLILSATDPDSLQREVQFLIGVLDHSQLMSRNFTAPWMIGKAPTAPSRGKRDLQHELLNICKLSQHATPDEQVIAKRYTDLKKFQEMRKAKIKEIALLRDKKSGMLLKHNLRSINYLTPQAEIYEQALASMLPAIRLDFHYPWDINTLPDGVTFYYLNRGGEVIHGFLLFSELPPNFKKHVLTKPQLQSNNRVIVDYDKLPDLKSKFYHEIPTILEKLAAKNLESAFLEFKDANLPTSPEELQVNLKVIKLKEQLLNQNKLAFDSATKRNEMVAAFDKCVNHLTIQLHNYLITLTKRCCKNVTEINSVQQIEINELANFLEIIRSLSSSTQDKTISLQAIENSHKLTQAFSAIKAKLLKRGIKANAEIMGTLDLLANNCEVQLLAPLAEEFEIPTPVAIAKKTESNQTVPRESRSEKNVKCSTTRQTTTLLQNKVRFAEGMPRDYEQIEYISKPASVKLEQAAKKAKIDIATVVCKDYKTLYIQRRQNNDLYLIYYDGHNREEPIIRSKPVTPAEVGAINKLLIPRDKAQALNINGETSFIVQNKTCAQELRRICGIFEATPVDKIFYIGDKAILLPPGSDLAAANMARGFVFMRKDSLLQLFYIFDGNSSLLNLSDEATRKALEFIFPSLYAREQQRWRVIEIMEILQIHRARKHINSENPDERLVAQRTLDTLSKANAIYSREAYELAVSEFTQSPKSKIWSIEKIVEQKKLWQTPIKLSKAESEHLFDLAEPPELTPAVAPNQAIGNPANDQHDPRASAMRRF